MSPAKPTPCRPKSDGGNSHLDVARAAPCLGRLLRPGVVGARVRSPESDPGELAETIANTVRFWSSEDPILSQLYGVVAVDAAAKDLVDRQRADRRGELERLARNLRESGRLRPQTSKHNVLALLLVLTSYETFRELRDAGLSESELTKTLQESARQLLLAGQ
jgi:hypothetical protein